MNKLLVILGPTATGKTDLGLSLAKKLNGELIACDSRQVYKGLDIGTGKLPGEKVKVEKGEGYWVLDGVKIWLYDVVDPKKQYTVVEYIDDAKKAVENIIKRSKLPIIVGGTGLYLRGLLEGFSNLGKPVDLKLREELEKLSLQQLQGRISTLSPIQFEKLNNSEKNNKRRLIRQIELISMYPYISTNTELLGLSKDFDILKIGLTAPRSDLNQRIDLRIISRINFGMIKEALDLKNRGVSTKRMKELGLEYGILADYLDGLINKEELITVLQNKIHQYAKRQLTWFKKEKEVSWFDITVKNYSQKVVKQASNWYN